MFLSPSSLVRLAALWAQYTSQESMVQVASKHNIELTFFHGKGGTVGRGGNPALYRAILSHPPNTINGRFRITEQGGESSHDVC
jgi:phosphoenolpyruvate carboxylase